MGQVVTERDLEILRLIAKFGYLQIPVVQAYFGLSVPRGYQLMQKLTKLGYVRNARVLHGQAGVYLLCKKGALACNVAVVRRVNLGSFVHDMLASQIILSIAKKKNMQFLTEREIKSADGFGRVGHAPDAEFISDDDKRYAVEVELTHKNKRKISKIMNWYSTQFHYVEVWYYCSSTVYNFICKEVEGMSFVKVFKLDSGVYEQ